MINRNDHNTDFIILNLYFNFSNIFNIFLSLRFRHNSKKLYYNKFYRVLLSLIFLLYYLYLIRDALKSSICFFNSTHGSNTIDESGNPVRGAVCLC